MLPRHRCGVITCVGSRAGGSGFGTQIATPAARFCVVGIPMPTPPPTCEPNVPAPTDMPTGEPLLPVDGALPVRRPEPDRLAETAADPAVEQRWRARLAAVTEP